MEVSKSDNFLEQVDTRVTLMAALSSKVNALASSYGFQAIWSGSNV